MRVSTTFSRSHAACNNVRTLPNLTEVVETKNIVKTADGAEADGKVIDVNSLVSMNMRGLTPDFLDVLEEGFKEFFEKEVPGNPLKAEYLIPIFIGELLEQGKMSVKVLKTNDIFNSLVEESHRSFCYHIVSPRKNSSDKEMPTEHRKMKEWGRFNDFVPRKIKFSCL